MTHIKKNLSILLPVCSIAVIVAIFLMVFFKKDQATFYLKDESGSRNMLSDLVISGYLQDKHHAQAFEISGGEISRRFIYYSDTKNVIIPPVRYGNGAEDGEYRYWSNYTYEISRDAHTRVEYPEPEEPEDQVNGTPEDWIEKTQITHADKVDIYVTVQKDWLDPSRRNRQSIDRDQVRFKPGGYLISESMDFTFKQTQGYYSSGSPMSVSSSFTGSTAGLSSYWGNGMTFLDHKLYVTVAAQQDDTNKIKLQGENGIFRVEEYGTWFEQETEHGKVKKIVAFDHSKDDLQIFGIHAVNGRLVAVLLADGILTFRTYEPDSGELLAELKVPEYQPEKDSMAYDPYIKGDTLSLDFTSKSEDQSRMSIIAVRIGDDLELLHHIDYSRPPNQTVSEIKAITPANGKLAVLAVFKDKDESIFNSIFYPRHYMLMVFDRAEKANSLLYSGEIITDADEDFIKYRNVYPSQAGAVAYDPYDTRDIAGVSIKEANQDD